MDSKSQLRALAARIVGSGPFIVVSNREPFVEERQGERVIPERPAGGLTAALHPVLNALDKAVWVAQRSGTACGQAMAESIGLRTAAGRPAYRLRRLSIPEKLAKEYYCGLANQGLWPLCHNVFQRPRFLAAEWESYRKVNEIFAAAVLEEAAGQPAVVFIQDYHFALLPRLLKKRNPALTVAHFWHIPWPGAEVFAAFPWKEELLEGMLGSDLLGFHLNQYCANFLDSVALSTDALVDRQHGRAIGGRHVTAVRDFPIGIDFEGHCELAESEQTRQAMEEWRHRLPPGVRIGIGIDRIDYTKGIPERIRAVGLFLDRHPEWRGKLVFVQVGVPSRGDIAQYRQLRDEIEQEVAAVNRKWRTPTWNPVYLVERNLPPEEMIALHRLASFCLVTSLHDGMNLVAKEFVASRPDLDAALVLSRFAGASRELSSAVLVNPFCEDQITQAILVALNLSPAERMRRMSLMRSAVRANNVYQWAANILSTLADLGVGKTGESVAAPRQSAAQYARASLAY